MGSLLGIDSKYGQNLKDDLGRAAMPSNGHQTQEDSRRHKSLVRTAWLRSQSALSAKLFQGFSTCSRNPSGKALSPKYSH